MSTTRNVVISAVIAAVIAITLVSATILSPGLVSSKTSSSSTSAAQSGTGTLAVMLTDPPTVPDGVTALYATYNNIAVHVSGAGNQSGWYDLHSSGQINLMGVVNVSQTVASASIPSGVYNVLRFNVTSAQVTYNGANYTALLLENQQGASVITVAIPGGVQVSNAQTSAAMLDLTPTVLLLGNHTDPSFAFIGAARAYTLPAQSYSRDDLKVGSRVDLTKQNWWKQLEKTAHFGITAASLTPSSFSITVDNTGNTSILFRMAAITPTTSYHGGFVPVGPESSAMFVVEPNGTLIPLGGNLREMAQSVLAGGYLLAPKTNATFSYSGTIEIGRLPISIVTGQATSGQQTSTTTSPAGSTTISGQSVQSITPGGKYVITVQANELTAKTSVIAGSS